MKDYDKLICDLREVSNFLYGLTNPITTLNRSDCARFSDKVRDAAQVIQEMQTRIDDLETQKADRFSEVYNSPEIHKKTRRPAISIDFSINVDPYLFGPYLETYDGFIIKEVPKK